jgi:hypothetical protein
MQFIISYAKTVYLLFQTASVFVQIVNMPLVRSTITIQNPSSPHETVRSALAHIYASKGVKGLWHGTSAGLMKSVPKYVTAVIIRDWCEASLPHFGDPNDHNCQIVRSALKSSIAGVAGAALTNPLDVIRNEMFKTDLSLTKTVSKLLNEEGIQFTMRGIGPNMTAVAIPIAVTIFMTDIFRSVKYRASNES